DQLLATLYRRWSNARLLGSIDVGGSPRIGRTAIAKRWRSCTSPQSGSCLESYAIRPKVFGQTLRYYERAEASRMAPTTANTTISPAIMRTVGCSALTPASLSAVA